MGGRRGKVRGGKEATKRRKGQTEEECRKIRGDVHLQPAVSIGAKTK